MTFSAENAVEKEGLGVATTTTDATDDEIARAVASRILAGDHDGASAAYMSLYERHGGMLWLFVASRAGRSDADDVTQEIWQRVWKYLPQRYRGGNFRAWLYEIARNYLIDCSRRRKNRPQAMADPAAGMSSVTVPDERLREQEEAAALARCLEDLGQRDATALQIVRARLRGESYAVLCARLELAEDRAYALFHQAKKQLTGCVERGLS